jgi:outer membrane protein assembly factor BamB
VTTAETDEQTKPRQGEAGPGFSFFSREGFARTFRSGGRAPDVTYRWNVLCLDGKTGDVVWERLAREDRPTIPIHRSNSYASETPVIDGERLYVYFGMTGLFCYDLAGQLLWNREIGAFPMQYGWGTGSSPIVYGERVFLVCDNEQESFLVAFDKRSGAEVWRVHRNEKSNWVTPFVWHNSVRDELVVAGGEKVRSYDPENGELLWEREATGRCATTPVADQELLYVGSVTRSRGGSGELIAIRTGAEGDLGSESNVGANSAIAWSVPRVAPELASPLLYQGCLYALSQHGGIIRCFDAKTGQRHYRKRLPGAGGFTASPWASNGKVFCLDENGKTHVLEAGTKLNVLGTNELDEMFWSSPAVVGENLLLRGVEHLYCIGS